MNKTFEFKKNIDLKHGANPHQKASLYNHQEQIDYELIKGETLSYGNILNATVALETIAEFFDVAAIVVAKNTNPVSVALSSDINSAYDKALDCDPICQFNSTMAFTREIELELAKKISEIPIELLIAPNFSNEALEELNKNKTLKILKINTPLNKIPTFVQEEIEMTPFGALIQEKNLKDFDAETFKIITTKKPEQKELEDMIFAFKVVKHVKSCGIVVAKDLKTLSISAGEANRIDSVENALNKVCDSTKDAILASDGTLSTINNIQAAAQCRISGIIQPAGIQRDAQLAQYADKMNISMVSTGIKHLKY